MCKSLLSLSFKIHSINGTCFKAILVFKLFLFVQLCVALENYAGRDRVQALNTGIYSESYSTCHKRFEVAFQST